MSNISVLNSLGMYEAAEELFPICRSITGAGVRETLKYIQKRLPDLVIHSVPSGTKAFDWVVPKEWVIRDAYIMDENKNKIIDFRKNNLHLVGYSVPVNDYFTLSELEPHLHSIPEQPDAIPYVTSYYKKDWGFCLSDNQKKMLKNVQYHVVIDSELRNGVLNYGELILPGESEEEIFLSTYICHPSMANNELSGPVVTLSLAQWISNIKNRRYTYRIIFIPETIGSIVYLSNNYNHMKDKVIAGFNITCVGDDRSYSYLPSRNGNTLSDKAALHVLKHSVRDFKQYTWLNRGSDERQYCSPGIDLPVATLSRTIFGEYPEYHTSLDNLELITPKGLGGAFNVLRRTLETIEQNIFLKTTVLGEPCLGKRGLYPTLSKKDSGLKVRTMMNLLSYCDGQNNLLDIADLIEEPFWELNLLAKKLIKAGLLEV